MTDVSVFPCASYDAETAEAALCAVLEPLGGLDFVTEGMTVVIKANLVSMMKPDSAATTNPVLISALTKLLTEKGARVVIGDSPGGLYNSAFVGRVYSVTGMNEAERAGAELNRDFSIRETKFPDGKVLRDFTYTSYLDSADVIIDFCKLKTHGMMGMSAAAKNLFGVIPGTFKPEYHFRFPDHRDFADMILDLNAYFSEKIRLCIADAVVGMEGNGPTQGKPRPIGVLAASASPHKLDLLCAALIGLGKDDVPTLEQAYQRGWIPASVDEMQISGDYRPFVVPDYDNIHVHKSLAFEGEGKFAAMFLRSALRAEPRPKKKVCVGCRKCADICPARAITMEDGKPAIDRKKCITCFCCQEFCPVGAMRVHRPLIARILNRKKKS